jgi:hypothetical protein
LCCDVLDYDVYNADTGAQVTSGIKNQPFTKDDGTVGRIFWQNDNEAVPETVTKYQIVAKNDGSTVPSGLVLATVTSALI